METWRPIIKGICVAIVLAAFGLGIKESQWWVAMLALNVALAL